MVFTETNITYVEGVREEERRRMLALVKEKVVLSLSEHEMTREDVSVLEYTRDMEEELRKGIILNPFLTREQAVEEASSSIAGEIASRFLWEKRKQILCKVPRQGILLPEEGGGRMRDELGGRELATNPHFSAYQEQMLNLPQ